MTGMRTIAAVFAIFIGLAIIGMWIVFLITGMVPELGDRPVETALHLAAELLTAFLLIAAGAGLLTHQPWGRSVFLTAMGALLYSVIQAAGYFAQQRLITFTGMFALFAILAAFFTVLMVLEPAGLDEQTQVSGRSYYER